MCNKKSSKKVFDTQWDYIPIDFLIKNNDEFLNVSYIQNPTWTCLLI